MLHSRLALRVCAAGALALVWGCPDVTRPPAGSGPSAPTASTASTASPAPSASVSPTPGSTPAGRFATSVTVSPATATIYVAPPRNSTPILPYTQQLSATVNFNDGTQATDVVWESGEGDRALVSEKGMVSAGIETGVVRIFATSRDGRALGYSTVTVKSDTGIEVGVD